MSGFGGYGRGGRGARLLEALNNPARRPGEQSPDHTQVYLIYTCPLLCHDTYIIANIFWYYGRRSNFCASTSFCVFVAYLILSQQI